MCGIAGYVGDVGRERLERMADRLGHRGPDDRGTFIGDGAGLAATRLAIIDLAGGHQPMASADGRRWIVSNGEIYNFRALGAELAARGHRLQTRSDTEVALHAFDAWGEKALDRLRGMFALAIWDADRRTLTLARDRLGKKPLYYHRDGGRLLFASEAKALLADPAIGRAVDPEALHHYLAFGYTGGARSIFAGIAKLPAGHVATFHDGGLTMRRYWSLPAASAVSAPDDPAEAVRGLVRDAVRLRLESDVPLGVFLSGGVDSSAVVAAMREVTTGPIATFTIGFAEAQSFDERRYARLVAERFGTDHHEELLAPKVDTLLEPIVRAFDEPFADSSAVATWTVAQATAQHVKVALSGIGGDEAFAGYPRYLGVRVSEAYRRVPRALRRAVAAGVRLTRESGASRDHASRARRFVAGAELPLPDRYLRWVRFFDVDALGSLVRPELRTSWSGDVEAAARAAWDGRRPGDPVDGAFRIDFGTYLTDDLLVMADRMSMAHGLELRAPFCDHALVELSLSLASATKLPGLRLKGLLKRAFADALPREVLSHPKQGFMVPLGRWLRAELRPALEELLSPARIARRGWLVPETVETLKREHLAGRLGHADRLFTLMMLELWAGEYLDRRGGPA
jgi:asparagine synthase (glutamine-hydrolysing)